MGVEKQNSKGSFFQLFDWNGKSRKKLFSNKSDLPDGSKQGKKSEENFPATKIHLFKDDEARSAVSSIKGSSDYSFASSSMDDEGNGVRAPSVVARLMGLDSLPISSIPDTYSTPFFESPQNTHSRNQPNKDDVSFSRKTVECKPQKLHNKPIERFQIETLPSNLAKSVPITQHKLLSPIKSPAGFITAKDAAHLMEAAAKILEPVLQNGTKGKILKAKSSSIPAKVRDLKENLLTSQKPISILPVVSRRPVESYAVNRLKDHSSNKSWNSSEDTEVGSKNKKKSISLAIQAKVNVQKREGFTLSRNLSVQKEHNEFKSNQSINIQTDVQKNKKKKPSTASVSSVLRQNNLKQNCPMNKDRVPSNPSVSFGRSKALQKVSGNTKMGCRKEGLETSDLEKEITSSRKKNFTRNKRSTDRNFHSEKNGLSGTGLVDRDVKIVQPNVAVDERLNQAEDYRRKGMDVISFTFTSPMKKTVSGSRPSDQMEEKRDTLNIDCVDSSSAKNVTSVKTKTLSSLGLNVIDGDALSILLEQKLRELTSGVEPSFSYLVKSGTDNNPPNLQDLVSKKSLSGSYNNKMGSVHDSGCSSTNGQLLLNMNHEFQGVEGIVKCSISSSFALKELEYPQPSPISILEASFSNETCNSPESYDSTDGSKPQSFFQAQKLLDSNPSKGTPSMEADTELYDTASSSAMETVTVSQMTAERWESEYVREIISNMEPSHLSEVIIDPLVFDKLENKKTCSKIDNSNDNKTWRKVLFDCVSESLDSKYGCYFRCGYRTWAKGVAVGRRDWLAEEVYKEILGWRSMGDWMVDELVDKDISSQLGSGVNFQPEEIEFGVEIEREIFCSLIDEVVADILA